MPRSKALQPLSRPLPGFEVQLFATATALPFAISLDYKTLYGAAATPTAILYQSVDDGTTWTTVKTFTGEVVIGLCETDDGEAVIYTSDAAATLCYVYRTTGWTASHTAATFTKVFTTTSAVRPFWGGGHYCSFGDDQIRAGSSKIGILNEYGPQFNGSNAAAASTRAYVTQDYGATWTQVIDLVTRYPGKTPLHTHASAYDPYWDRMWLTYGDTQGDADTTKQGLLYSDDRGGTWTAVTLPPEWQNIDYLQSISFAILEDCILIGSDNTPGYLRISRQGYRKAGPAQVIAVYAPNTGGLIIANGMHRNRRQPGAPLLMTFQAQANDFPSGLIVSYDGLTFYDLHRDPQVNNTRTVSWTLAFGPTYNGYIVGNASNKLIRGEILWPEASMFDNVVTFTGDGTTTVFTIAHGLGVTPTQIEAWSTNAVGGTYVVTADATNLIFTFTTAPTASTYPSFAYRYSR